MYDAKYFLKKFEAIPEEMWRDDGKFGKKGGPMCVMAHCGVDHKHPFKDTDESKALRYLITFPHTISDGGSDKFRQPTPKQRIIAAVGKLL